MTIGWQEQLRPGAALKGIVQQATAALVAMDADRLEELAECCADLNRELDESGYPAEDVALVAEAAGDLELLDRVLFEPRANLTVLTRLHQIRLRTASALRASRPAGKAGVEPALDFWVTAERKADYGDN